MHRHTGSSCHSAYPHVEVCDGFLSDFCKQMFWIVEAGSSCLIKLFSNVISNAKIQCKIRLFYVYINKLSGPWVCQQALVSLTSLTRASTHTLWTWTQKPYLSMGLGIQSLPGLCCSSASLHFNHSCAYVLKSTKRTLLYYQILPRNWFCLHVCFSRMELRDSQDCLGVVLISLCCSIHHHPLPLVFYSSAWERKFVSPFCLQQAEQSEKLIKGEYFDL